MANVVGRPKKPAKRVNFNLAFDLLATLKAIATIEDRSDTAQLERALRGWAEQWEASHPERVAEFKSLKATLLKDMESSDD